MIRRKFIGFILVFLLLVLSAYAFRIPARVACRLLPVLIKHKCGFSVRVGDVNGGLFYGIILSDLEVYNDRQTILSSPQIYTNIKLKDILLFRFLKDPYIFVTDPEIYLRYPLSPVCVQLTGDVGIVLSKAKLHIDDDKGLFSLMIEDLVGRIDKNDDSLSLSFYSNYYSAVRQENTQASFTGKIGLVAGGVDCKLKLNNYPVSSLQADLSGMGFVDGVIDMEMEITDNSLSSGYLIMDKGQLQFPGTTDLPVSYSGRIDLYPNGISIKNGEFNLASIKTKISGSISKDQDLDLELDTSIFDSPLSLTGDWQMPKIAVKIGPLETMVQMDDLKYNNNDMVMSQVVGQMKLSGFDSIEFNGGLKITNDKIILEQIRLADVIEIAGLISRKEPSRLQLSMNDVAGEQLADYLPVALKPFISSHKINGFISAYGPLGNIQAGGKIELASSPLTIVCRYRNNRFSFRSLADSLLAVSGSINWDETAKIKMDGQIQQMEFKELLSMFSSEVDPETKGVVDGEFTVSGEIDFPVARAKLEIQNGEIGSVQFDMAYLNIEWSGNVFEIKHSMVYYKEIPAQLKGYIDPKSKNVLGNIEIVPMGDIFTWKGLNVKKDVDEKAVIFGRELGDNVSVNFRSPQSSDPGHGDIENDPELEVKYKIKEDKNLLIKLEEDEGTVGIEHNVKF